MIDSTQPKNQQLFINNKHCVCKFLLFLVPGFVHVRVLMVLELRELLERLAAVAARVRTHTAVNLHVNLHGNGTRSNVLV